MKVSLLSGGKDPHYVFGLVSGLINSPVEIDLIGSDYMKDSNPTEYKNLHIYEFFESKKYKGAIWKKIAYILKYYYRLFLYAATTDSQLFHIQWEHKLTYFDRTILNAYFKIFKKKLIYTAHNIDAGSRDQKNSIINKLSLRFIYSIMDIVIVHTNKMKQQLLNDFHVKDDKVAVIPFGINNMIPVTGLTPKDARDKLLPKSEDTKIILFFGNIAPYKGLIDLVFAANILREKLYKFKLIIAGRIKNGCEAYWHEIQNTIQTLELNDFIIQRQDFIPDAEIELYFKAADVLVLPYRAIYQSGILFIAYRFGLPVIATDVGSLKEDIIEGKTGFICSPADPEDLAKTVEHYFISDLSENLNIHRERISRYAADKYSWDKIGKKTYSVYRQMLYES